MYSQNTILLDRQIDLPFCGIIEAMKHHQNHYTMAEPFVPPKDISSLIVVWSLTWSGIK